MALPLVKTLADRLVALEVQGPFPFVRPPTNGYVMTSRQMTATAPSAAALVSDRIIIAPFIAPLGFTATQSSINVTGGAASSQVRIVCFSANSNGRPDALLWESADFDTSTTGEKIDGTDRTIDKGVTYWLGVRTTGTPTVSVTPLAGAWPINGSAAFSTAAASTLVQTLTWGTSTPATWTWSASDINTTLPVVIGFRI
jgi:hypothetical protein